MISYILIGILVILLFYVVLAYNGLIKYKNRVEEAWSDIDVQLKRRHDLIPNLVNTVKGYAKHEKSVLENVTKARSQAMQAKKDGNPGEIRKAENQLKDTLKSLFAVSENYPDLKASQNFKELQRELTDTENKIQAARRFYNRNVKSMNIKIEQFPSNIIANLFNFDKKEFFEADEKERENVEVSF
ncbi:MAG: LemA family protein [Candidatus Woesearchaeota archaeon]